jgi:O-antigen ligase
LAARTHVDSFYMTLLPELGIAGMIPLAIIVFRAIAQGFANYRVAAADLKPYALGIFGALLALLISMMTTYAYSDVRFALLLWQLLAMTVVLQRLVGPGAAP